MASPPSVNPGTETRVKKTLTRHTLGGVFWASSGTIVQALSMILITVILARLLTPTDFGLASAATVIVGFCQIWGQLGVGYALVQRATLRNEHIETGFTLSILLGSLLTITLLAAAPFISTLFYTPELVPILRVFILVFAMRSLAIVAEALLQRDLRFQELAGIQSASFVAYAIAGIALGFAGWGVWALVGAQFVQTGIETVAMLLLRPHSKRMLLEKDAAYDLLNYGSGMTLAKLANFVSLQGDNLVVMRGLGIEALGLYSRAYRLMALPANLMGEGVEKVVFSTVSKVQSDPTRMTTAYRRSIALVSILVLPISAVVIVLAPEIVEILLGLQWMAVVAPLQALSFGMFFRTGYKVGDTISRAQGAVHRVARYKVIYSFLIIASAFIGQFFGLTGVAIGVSFSLLIYYFVSAQLTLSLTSMKFYEFLRIHAPALFLALAAFSIAELSAYWLRLQKFHATAVLLITSIVVVLLLSGLVRLVPTLAIGHDGIWWIQTLARFLPLREKFVKQGL